MTEPEPQRVEPPEQSAWKQSAWLGPHTARWLTPILLLLGVECWLILGEGNWGFQNKPGWIGLAILAGLFPPIARLVNRFWLFVAHPRLKTRLCIALLISVVSSGFLLATLRYEHIAFRPEFTDELSYQIQMHMLARGRLWMPPLAMPRFFDTFYILTQPVYASVYFPGAAMMYVPQVWLHLPSPAGPLAVAGLCAGMLYLMIGEALDGGSALLGVLLLLSLRLFRILSILFIAQLPMLLLGLTMTFATLQWQKDRRKRWLILLGIAGGWAAITRPLDALCFAMVAASVIAMELRHAPLWQWVQTALAVVLAAAPFLVLQIVINAHVTGRWLTTPFALWNDAHYPGAFGFPPGHPPAVVSDVPEVQLYYQSHVMPIIAQHTLGNLLTVGAPAELSRVRWADVADPLLWLITPLALPALWNRRVWAVWGLLPVFLVVMSVYAFSWDLRHYFIMTAPAVILISVLPIRFLTQAFASAAGMIRTALGLSIVFLALAAMPQFNRIVDDRYFLTPEMDRAERDLAEIPGRAVVLFHFDPGKNDPGEEPALNAGVAWPDDARVIRARDLNDSISRIGTAADRDIPLYAYYRRIAPARVFYFYDRGAGEMRRIGTAGEILEGLAGRK
jgi:hypothetical protein